MKKGLFTCLICVLLTLVLLSAAAADTNPPQKLGAPNWEAEEDVIDVFNVNKQMQIGENAFEIDAGKRKNLGFTPEESGLYAIYSIGDYDTYGMLRDPNLNVYAENDDRNGENYNFYIEYGLKANTPYIVGVQFYSQTQSGTVTVVLEKIADACGDNLAWSFDAPTGTLTITGSGYMWPFENGMPWAAYTHDITTVSLPDGMINLEEFAFAACENLTSINIPASIVHLGAGAFMGCRSLTSDGISIDPGCTYYYINDGVLYYRAEGWGIKTYLASNTAKTYKITGNMDAIDNYAFADCDYLEAVTIDDVGLYDINEGMFMDCSALEYAGLFNVDRIYKKAFWDCTSLRRIVITTELDFVEANSFVNCSALTDVYYLGTEAERNANLTIESTGNAALLNATWHYEAENELESFMCGDLLFWSFDDSTGAFTVTGTGAMWPMYDGKPWWSYVHDITSVSLPEGITTVAPFAFARCDILTSINIPASVTSIGEGAFMGCRSLTPEGISIDPGCTGYYMQKGALCFHGDGWGIHTYLASNPEKTYKITGNMDAIDEYAFADCDYLEAVTIEDTGLYDIGRGMFQDCSSLEYAGLYNVYRIDDYAFFDCTSLRRIVITTDLERVYANAFLNCNALSHVYYLGTEAERNANLTIESTGNTKLLNATWHYVDDVSTFMCGDYLFWYYNSEMHALVIEGAGDMWDFEWKAAPWFEAYSDDMWVAVIDSDVTRIGNYAFMNCTSIVGFTLPLGLQTIGENAFENNHTMTEIDIPASVKAIEDCAFRGCDVLETVTLHEGLDTIGEKAFSGCWALNEFHIPASVMIIGAGAFRQCYALPAENFTIDPGSITYRIEDGVLFTYDYDLLHTYLISNPQTEYTIPESVTEISNFAFEECDSLVTVRLPRWLYLIGSYAFSDCDNLTTVDLTSNVNTICEGAFEHTAIKVVRIPKNVQLIQKWAFSYCSSLTTVEIPKTVTQIEKGAFHQYNNAITDVYYTGTEAERNANLTIDNTSNYNDPILNATWHYETSLTSFMCGDDLYWEYDSRNHWLGIHGTGEMWDFPYFGATPWESYRTSVRSILIANSSAGSNVTSIGAFAFAGFTGVTSFSMPNSIRRIGLCALYDCTALETVKFSTGLTEIGTSAFLRCTALEGITLPASLTDIGPYAFAHCSTIPSVTIPAGVTYIGEAAFSAMDSVPAFTVAEGNTAYCAVDGVLFTIDGKTLMQYPGGNTATSYEIPSGVEFVAEDAFAFNTHLVTVDVPNTVTGFAPGVFACCEALESIILPDSISGVSGEMFTNCHALETIMLPGTITFVGDAAFYGCDALTDVYFIGTETMRNAIEFNVDNEYLENATWHYLPIVFRSQALTLEGRIGVNFFIELPQDAGVTYEGVEFTIDSIDGVPAFVPFKGESHPTNGSGYYLFTYYVRTIEMANTITASLRYTLNGSVGTLDKTYSVKTYFDTFDHYISLFTVKQQNMVKATADLGHYIQAFLAAQKGWTFGTDYAEMDKYYAVYTADDISAAAAALAPYEVNKSTGTHVSKINYTLVLDSDTELRVFFKPAKSYTGAFTFTVNGETVTEDGEKMRVSLQSDGRYMVSIKNIAAHELSNVYVIKALSDGDEASITVSALSYANAMITGYANDSAWVNAAIAIWRYATAAEAMMN